MKWITRRKLVDIETGEIIENENDYKKIKTIKNVRANKTTERGVIEYTIECRRNERFQGKLF